jgi:large subunit ribosomal protein L24
MAAHAPVRRATKVPEIRKGDTVVVLSGRDAGKRGTVERVLTNAKARAFVGSNRGAKGRVRQSGFWKSASPHPVSVVVQGVNIAKRHTKPRQSTSSTDRMPKVQSGGILEIAQPMPIGKVMLVCNNCGKPTRVGHRTLDNGRRVRMCRQCGEQLEVKS